MVRFIPALAVCALCQAAASDAVQAQPLYDGVGPVYKCRAEGKVSYGDQPCAHGPTLQLAVPPAPPAAPALEHSRRERETLARIEKLRLERDLRAERDTARERRAAAAQGRRCARLRLRHQWAGEDLARASGLRAAALRRKAQRQAEALAVECPA